MGGVGDWMLLDLFLALGLNWFSCFAKGGGAGR